MQFDLKERSKILREFLPLQLAPSVEIKEELWDQTMIATDPKIVADGLVGEK